MQDHNTDSTAYAYLPEDLLLQMLHGSAAVADNLADLIDISNTNKVEGRKLLEDKNLIIQLGDTVHSENLIAVDGANIIEKMTGADLVMAIAVGVEGVSSMPSENWTQNCRQHYAWQAVLPHHPANSRLTQGIMFLMELSILANTDHEFRIMDGGHITSIMKLNSLLSANAFEAADQQYVSALSTFLNDNYNKIIPDIPNIIRDAFSCDAIVGMSKYSSSREIIDSVLSTLHIPSDDKTFFSLTLNPGEYTQPLPVGQSKKDYDQWNNIHIKCNLDLQISPDDITKLNDDLELALEDFLPGHTASRSSLYFLYYKPLEGGICYRLEVKETLANDKVSLERLLASIRSQIFFPEIQEPYPQFLADVIAKNISLGMSALQNAVRSNPRLAQEENFNLLLSYRS